MNNLSDKELRAIFHKEKRIYKDDLFRQQVMRKTEAFQPDPFLKIILITAFVYMIFSVILFVPSLREASVRFISEQFQLISGTGKMITDIYLFYVGLILFMLVCVIRIIKKQYQD